MTRYKTNDITIFQKKFTKCSNPSCNNMVPGSRYLYRQCIDCRKEYFKLKSHHQKK